MSSINKNGIDKQLSKKYASDVILYLFLVLFAVIIVFPYLWMFFTSLKHSSEIFTHEMRLFPKHWQFDNYLQVILQGSFIRSIMNSLFVTVFGVVFEVTIAFMSAYAFAKLDFYGKDLVFLLILGTLMIPPQVLMLPSFIIISDLGWLNSYKGLIFPRAGAAFGIFLLRQFMLTVPKELDDAAKVDGANIIRIMFGIYLPVCLPPVVTVSVFSMLGFWNDYYWPLVITSDSNMRTVALGIAQFKNLEGMGNWELLMAASMLATLPMLIVFIFARKTLIDNLTAGAVKG